MSEHVIHVKDAKTLYEYTDFPFSLGAYLREEVVRCRDCVYMTNRKYKNSLEYQTCSFFDSEYAEVEPNGFCAWGEHK